MTKDEFRKLHEAGKIDGKCQCGHLQKSHTAETNYPDRQNRSSVQGHGHCIACTCHQFSWVGWSGYPPPVVEP